jgi:hypothetical protein
MVSCSPDDRRDLSFNMRWRYITYVSLLQGNLQIAIYTFASGSIEIMAPRLGHGHDGPSSSSTSKSPAAPPTREKEAEKLRATLPEAVSLDARSCTVDEIVEAMKITGVDHSECCAAEALDYIRITTGHTLFPHISAISIPSAAQFMANVIEKRGHATPVERRHSRTGDFYSKETRWAYRLLSSPTCAREDM